MEAVRSSRRFVVGALCLYGLHLLALAYVFPWRVVVSELPYGGGDYQTHFHQTYRITESLRASGPLWGYETNYLAGHPTGLIFDVDNKAHFLFSYGLSRLGLPLATAYNLFAVVSAILAPLVLLWAARLLRLPRGAQLAVLALMIPVYFLDTICRFFTTAGMISFVMTSHLSLLVIALFWRLLQTPGREGLRFFLPLLALFPLAQLTHVWAFGILVGPLTILYLHAFRRLPRVGHAQVLLLAAAVLAVNAYWLWPAMTHSGLMTYSEKLGQAKPFYFLLDLFEILPFRPPVTAQTTFFRYVALACAAVVAWRWARQRDERTVLAVTVLGWLFFLTYVSAYLPFFRLTEPYRFVLPLTFAALLLGSALPGEILSRAGWRAEFGANARVLGGLALLLLLPQIGRQVLAAGPELIPKPEPILPLFDPPPWTPREPDELEVTLRMKSVAPEYLEVASYLKRECREPGRVLVEPWELGEFLGWATDHHVIGGFPERRLIYENANLFREGLDERRYWGRAMTDYLARYNIRYVIVHLPLFPMIELRRDLFQLQARVGPYRVYRTKQRSDFFVRGSGRISTAPNRILIEEATPSTGTEQVAIRFHYLETLRCSPRCRLEREPLADSRASFIRVVGTPKLARTITLEHRP